MREICSLLIIVFVLVGCRKESYWYYQKGTDLGYIPSIYHFAFAYGRGVKEDKEKAQELYKKLTASTLCYR